MRKKITRNGVKNGVPGVFQSWHGVEEVYYTIISTYDSK
jgi:hypothetical protein